MTCPSGPIRRVPRLPRRIGIMSRSSIIKATCMFSRSLRVKRFRKVFPIASKLTLEGPSYSELAEVAKTNGPHQILLRFEPRRDPGQLPTGAGITGTPDTGTGPVFGVPLDPVEFRIIERLQPEIERALAPRLVIGTAADGSPSSSGTSRT